MTHQFIFTMQRVRKVHPPDNVVIQGMTLAFLPGAKIGVLGANGSGKSSLLKIMAGVDAEIEGETWHPDGVRIGYLPQEPRLDEALDVRGNVELAVAQTRDLLTTFEELSLKMGEDLPDDEMDRVMEQCGQAPDAIEAVGGWELDNTIDVAM
ncbi:MAG: ATP-binding cassette domain-containing protein, partial [Deltaproteobacteria bacterium]|nr:ATP-binding cassette domain-containing protein [Deltaproteobacteria bacterium]